MNASQGREPARPKQGSGAGGAQSNAAAGQPKLSREAVVAFVLLPVLLAAGFFLGGRLIGGDDAGSIDAAQTDTLPDAGDPGADDPGTDTGAAGGEEPAAPIGPTAPTPEINAEPTVEPAPEPTEAAPAPEPTEPTEAAPAPEPTEPTEAAPAPEPTEPPAPTEAPQGPTAPSTEPTQAPAPDSQALPSDPGLLPTVVDGIPQPTAGDSVLLFPGFAGEDVRTWQARMVERGWDLQVDGIYGERTAEVARSFQVQKGLVVDGLVGPETWSAAWTAPIT